MVRRREDKTVSLNTQRFVNLLGSSVTKNPTRRTDATHLLITSLMSEDEKNKVAANEALNKAKHWNCFGLAIHKYNGGDRVFIPVRKVRGSEDVEPSALGKLLMDDPKIRVEKLTGSICRWYAASIPFHSENINEVVNHINAAISSLVSISPSTSQNHVTSEIEYGGEAEISSSTETEDWNSSAGENEV